jgi:hypothetical protein
VAAVADCDADRDALCDAGSMAFNMNVGGGQSIFARAAALASACLTQS